MLPTVLRVGSASASTSSNPYHLDLAGADLRLAIDGWHAILPLGGTNHRLWLPALPGQSPIAVELPLDRDFDIRAAAARRLWSAFEQRRTGPPRSNLSVQRRQRLTLALRALDGHAAGNNYRSIAQVLFGSDLVTERTWKTHDLRSRTIRLVQNAAMLVRGGYRALLRVGRGQ